MHAVADPYQDPRPLTAGAAHKPEPMALRAAADKLARKAAALAALEEQQALQRLTARTAAAAPSLHTTLRAAARSGTTLQPEHSAALTRSASAGVSNLMAVTWCTSSMSMVYTSCSAHLSQLAWCLEKLSKVQRVCGGCKCRAGPAECPTCTGA